MKVFENANIAVKKSGLIPRLKNILKKVPKKVTQNSKKYIYPWGEAVCDKLLAVSRKVPKFFDIFRGKYRRWEADLLCTENWQTSTNYIVLQMHCQDYQLVAKNMGVNSIPPLSSFILLFSAHGLTSVNNTLP